MDKFEKFTLWLEGFIGNSETLSEEDLSEIKNKLNELRETPGYSLVFGNGTTPNDFIINLSADELTVTSPNKNEGGVFKLTNVSKDTKIGRTTFAALKTNDVLVAKSSNQMYLFAAFWGFSKSDGSAIFKILENNDPTQALSKYFVPNSRVKVAGRFLRIPENSEVLLLDDSSRNDVEFANKLKIGSSKTKRKSNTNYTPDLSDDEKQMVNETAGLATMEALEEYHKKSESNG